MPAQDGDAGSEQRRQGRTEEEEVDEEAEQCRALQLEELELVAAAFPEAEPRDDGRGFSVRLEDSGLHLSVGFPRGYPARAPPTPTVQPSDELSVAVRSALQRQLSTAAVELHEEGGGDECSALQLLLAAPDLLEGVLGEPEPEPEPEPEQAAAAAQGQDEDEDEGKLADEGKLRVVLIRFDHIKAPLARKVIASLASDLRLGGICRPGKPGLVCAEGTPSSLSSFESELRRQLGTCTRTMGCWGPDNHHFQSISVVGQVEGGVGEGARERRFQGFLDVETETLMHACHLFARAGLEGLFFEGCGLDPDWAVPSDTGGPDPYLKPRGGTKMKKSNKRLH